MTAASPLRRRALLLAGALTLSALSALGGCRKAEPAAATLTDYGALPEFALIDANERPVTSRGLAGRPYVLNTFFTSCRSICPGLMATVRTLRARVPELRVLSVTVDPDNDTPKVLRTYGAGFAVDGETWRLVTGDYDAIRALVVGGLKTAVGDKSQGADMEHSAKLMLIDGQGHLRGWFSSDAPGLDALVAAAAQL